MKIIKNKNGLLQLIIVILIASVFVTSLILIQNYFTKTNNLKQQSTSISDQAPTPFQNQSNKTNDLKHHPTPLADRVLIPTQAPPSNKCIELNARGCNYSFPCCNGGCYHGQCVAIPGNWKTYNWSYYNISFKYPPEWGESESPAQPYFGKFNDKHFWVAIYGGFNIDDPQKFLELWDNDGLLWGHKTSHTKEENISVGSYKAVMREEYNYNNFRRLGVYFTDDKHFVYAIYWDSGRPMGTSDEFSEKERQNFNLVISSIKTPLDPNSSKPYNNRYSEGCTSLFDTGCIKSGKCCWGDCKNDKCEQP